MDVVFLIARILFVIIAITGAIGHFLQADAMTQYATYKGAPLGKAGVILSGIGLGVGGLMVLLGNEPLSGDDALTWGLVSEVVETDEDVVTRTDAIAARLAALSPSALAAAKRMVKGSWSTTREENAVEEADTIAHQLGTPEAQAAVAGFARG